MLWVLLKLRANLIVVQATVCPHPGIGSQLVVDGTGQHVGVAGGKGMERCVVCGADGPSYRRWGWLSLGAEEPDLPGQQR